MSLKCLAFDTSTEVCSVALMVNNNIYERSFFTSLRHEEKILSIIDNVLSDAEIALRSLDCLVCSRGPGSFIGVRIGISLAQGLALGADLPLVQVSSLKILAEGIWRSIGAKQVLSTINARLGELYLACYYRKDDNRWLRRGPESIITPIDMCTLISKLGGEWVLVGTGWNRYPILCSNKNFQINTRKVLFPSAKDMLELARISFNDGDLFTVDQIQPVYLEKMKWNKVS